MKITKRYNCLKNRQAGFSILELSIVITITSILIAGGLMVSTGYIENSRVKETNERLDVIEEALQKYIIAYKRLPCPADPNVLWGDSNLGTEKLHAGNTDCAYMGFGQGIWEYMDGVPNYAWEGDVPVKTLGLPVKYMLDGWGRRMSYAVGRKAIRNIAPFPFDVGGSYYAPTTTGDLSVSSTHITSYTCGDDPALIAKKFTKSGAIYVVFSSGKDGHGARMRQGGFGARVQASVNNKDTIENAHLDANNNPLGFDYCFVQGEEWVENPASPSTTGFDDILRFKTRWQISIQ